MDAMAVHAGLFGTTFNYIPCVGINVTVSRVESGVVCVLEIHFEVGKQIVAYHEIVGIGQSGGLGTSTAQMALAAGRNNFAWLARTLGTQQGQLGVCSVLLLDVAVAGKAIEGEGRKRVRLRINTCGMASGAFCRKDVILPGLAIRRQEGEFPVTNQLERMEVLRAANNVGCICSRFRNGRSNAHFPDGPCVRLLLPRGADHTLMAEEALVAGHVIR